MVRRSLDRVRAERAERDLARAHLTVSVLQQRLARLERPCGPRGLDEREPRLYLRRSDGTYDPVEPFDGFPAPGVWQVIGDEGEDGRLRSVSCTKLGDVPPEVGLTRASLEQARPACYEALRAAIERATACRDCGERHMGLADPPHDPGWWPSPEALVTALLDALAGEVQDG